jgi:hypothetical protein
VPQPTTLPRKDREEKVTGKGIVWEVPRQYPLVLLVRIYVVKGKVLEVRKVKRKELDYLYDERNILCFSKSFGNPYRTGNITRRIQE